MADNEKPEDEVEQQEGQEQAEDSAKTSSKGSLKLLAAIVCLIAIGSTLAVVAMPTKEKPSRFAGPYFYALSEVPLTVTATDSHGTRYVKFKPSAEYVAYTKSYVPNREKDPFFLSYLDSKVLEVSSTKSIDEMLRGAKQLAFAEEIRHAIDPIVFPVHLGDTTHPLDMDEKTGLRPGSSHMDATFRGRIHDHVLKFDGQVQTIQIGTGPVATFRGDEEDLMLEALDGTYVYIDVTGFEADFRGEVPIGCHGKLRKIILNGRIAQ
ncbi:MAG: hypothetical protein V3T22_10675 [Planctomycetota bacterium]